MIAVRGRATARLSMAALVIAAGSIAWSADKPLPTQSANRLPTTDLNSARRAHPLSSVIDYARQEQRYMSQTVNDFTCRLVKRERINGFLQDMHFIDLQVREAVHQGDQIVRPLSIYLQFHAPKNVAGRKIVFVEGQNDGKMLVRNGGRHFDYVVAQIDPNGENAREETLVPITDIGFTRLMGRMIEVLERHREADSSGDNTKVDRIKGAKINNRTCTVIRVTHPKEAAGLEFHQAHVFVDDELHAPLRVDYSSWPKRPGTPPPLIAEYTYTDLRLNVNLPDSTFTRGRLRAK